MQFNICVGFSEFRLVLFSSLYFYSCLLLQRLKVEFTWHSVCM